MPNPTGRGGFAKGQSGNPGGRRRELANLRAEARRHTGPALQTVLKLMRSGRSEAVRLGAAQTILDRGWGKPIQSLQVDGRFLTKKLSELTPSELEALEQRIELIEDQGELNLIENNAELQ
jgi:hypothetical protein